MAWDVVIAAAIIYSFITVPFYICYAVDPTGAWLAVDQAIDVLYALDMIASFRTAFPQDSGAMVLVTVPRLIARRYLSTWFVPDLLSTVPVDLAVALATGTSTSALRSLKLVRTVRLVRLLKLFRVMRLQRLSAIVEDSVALSPALLRLLTLFFQARGARTLASPATLPAQH